MHLTEDEEREFQEITAKVAALGARAEEDPDIKETIKMLLIRRASIMGAAGNKLPRLLEALGELKVACGHERRDLRDVLIYCAPGTHRKVLKAVAGSGLRCHEFVHTVGLSKREEVLGSFARGDIQALVAIKCLDEGVDVPSTRTAFFLASTTNPREFVQRRGRILRLAEGKDKAVVFDFVVVPSEDTSRDVGKALLRRELPRFAEFSFAASNEFKARSIIRDILDRYEMLNLLDERPWEMYHKLRGSSTGLTH